MKILAVQNRMGIGDTIIFLPFIKALFEKYNSPISLLVKESSKADQYFCLLYTSPSPRDGLLSRMPSSA